jgi:O-antigen biosynthesis protein
MVNLEHQARYEWAARVAVAGTVLDAGCGIGSGTALLAMDAKEAVGVDSSPAAIEDAQREYGERATFRVGDIRCLPFEDGEFDVVACFEAIAHIAETDAALDELRRVLRPGGTLLISSPNRGAYPPGNPLHLREVTSDELRTSLSSRFANVGMYGQRTCFASLLGVSDVPARDTLPTRIRAGVTKLVRSPPGSEPYSVAAATDGALPPEPTEVVLGEHLDYEEQQRKLDVWQRRAVEAEAEVLSLKNRLQR